ncbi:MAG TPA: band 7 protein, partial [Propionibacteriaceae bacterium]|nr:band 7 protein [Propionibacteriaceae bacterium]
MSDTDLPLGKAQDSEPAATPVGHDGVRVEIAERSAWSINGGAGLLLLVV